MHPKYMDSDYRVSYTSRASPPKAASPPRVLKPASPRRAATSPRRVVQQTPSVGEAISNFFSRMSPSRQRPASVAGYAPPRFRRMDYVLYKDYKFEVDLSRECLPFYDSWNSFADKLSPYVWATRLLPVYEDEVNKATGETKTSIKTRQGRIRIDIVADKIYFEVPCKSEIDPRTVFIRIIGEIDLSQFFAADLEGLEESDKERRLITLARDFVSA